MVTMVTPGTIHGLGLELQAQRQLNVPWVVALSQPHLARRGYGQAGVGPPKLRRIRHIERFRAELQVQALVYLDGLEHGDVRVRYPGRTEAREPAAQRPQCIRLLLNERQRFGRAGAVLPGAGGEERTRIERPQGSRVV